MVGEPLDLVEKPLRGKKVAVIVEHKFIPEEIAAYQSCFTLPGPAQ